MLGCMLPMPFLCLRRHVAFTRTHADMSTCTRRTHSNAERTHKRLQAEILLWERTVKYMGLITGIALFFSPLAFKIMHAWLGVWLKFCLNMCLVICVYKTCCVTWFHAISIF